MIANSIDSFNRLLSRRCMDTTYTNPYSPLYKEEVKSICNLLKYYYKSIELAGGPLGIFHNRVVRFNEPIDFIDVEDAAYYVLGNREIYLYRIVRNNENRILVFGVYE